ncbi:MAG: COX15/CtaA family protein, partial [Erythrobacter sp.]|nr:COX15/CtaA family protein [Erythrobacter sp.]
FHRFLGRLVGVAFALPFVWFAIKRAIPKGYGWRLWALFLLGGSQGALGWYMVQSGLVDRTDVSHFRLSAHLLTAFFILAGLVWTALNLKRLANTGQNVAARLTPLALGVSLVLLVQLLLGAWVAGLDAGYVTREWPLMLGQFYPANAVGNTGDWLYTLTHDPFLIHFLHRWWAWIAAAALIVMAIRIKPVDRRASIAIHATLGLQILLGIGTVWSGMNIVLAASHQAVGALLVASLAWGAHVLGRNA